ncbi:Proteophosphoglycan ppg4 [Rhodotorula toruloides ATCC 204091]|uniref:BY PROTMAP: gi/342321201/gb/EGU13136.1/ Proteophosphoglycan ppg4 [Rhodotorula glutinis ATCC 204091] n=2 Tax=Rhodotorula toruloides TaxID=5286 RepID=A0A0K3CNP6_RHOTO|nr:Proteophosphoglycan ppg4 [Rhodotorula toruloides ATCC 204091]
MPRSPEPQLVRRLEMPAGGANDAPSSDSESEDGAADGEEVYEVEAIRASRFDATTSAMRYLVKWKGYSEDEKTWEPIENLENCLDLVTEYNKRKEEREARRASITPGVSLQDALNKNIRLPGASADESSDQGLSMKELDARRAKAKKKQSRGVSTASTSAGRVEDAVADKWEKKATGKEQKRKSASTAASPVASTSKAAQVQQPPKKKKAASKSYATGEKPKSSQKKRTVEDAKATPPPAKKPKKARPVVASESSDSDDHGATVRRPKQPTPLTADIRSMKDAITPAAPPSTAKKPTPTPPAAAAPDAAPALTASGSAQRLPPEPTPQPQQTQTNKQEPLKTALAPIIDEAASQARSSEPVPQGPWTGALGKLLSKSFRKPPPPPPPLAEQPPAGDGRVRFQEDPVRLAQTSAPPRHSTAAQPHSALRQTSLQPSPIEPNGATPPQPLGSVSPNLRPQQVPAATDPRRRPQGSPAPIASHANDSRAASPVEAKPQVQVAQPQAPVEDVTAREKKVKDRATQLQNLENRLRRSTWFQSRPEFVTEDLTVACTMAIPIDPHLVMRLKGKGVAVLVSHGRDETVSGEGLALACLLMRMGATTPSNMQEVEAVCIHRKEPLAALEALYCELVNLERHFVEFFYFGGDEPATPVFTHGYHVLPTLAALQQGAAFDRFCQFSRDPVSGHCVVAVHPATVAMARKEVNWPRIHDSLAGHQIDVIGREMIKLDSAFATVEKSELLERAVTFRPLPHVTSESEFAEIFSHSVHVRANYPTVWRRFIVVVSESVEEQVQKARTCGVEVHTWSSLAELVTANPFG